MVEMVRVVDVVNVVICVCVREMTWCWCHVGLGKREDCIVLNESYFLIYN